MLAGYAVFLVAVAGTLEWLSAHTHRRSLRYRTAGFTYDELHDHWRCPEGEHLWPHEFDHDRRLVRYRARAHICNGCPRKADCTDSDRGREIVRPIDPWPHSEAGRFHRVIAVSIACFGILVIGASAALHHGSADLAVLGVALLISTIVALYLWSDLRASPAGFPWAEAERSGQAPVPPQPKRSASSTL